jgi:hypothetical protein
MSTTAMKKEAANDTELGKTTTATGKRPKRPTFTHHRLVNSEPDLISDILDARK